ncbi:MAG: hypothetical protein GY708_30380 [Actinomycetia bacterium]|nr:hypothetical protein [Actinomycetes bacterium]
MLLAGATANPTGDWTPQAARNLFLHRTEHLNGARALVRDRGRRIIDAFNEILRTARCDSLINEHQHAA